MEIDFSEDTERVEIPKNNVKRGNPNFGKKKEEPKDGEKELVNCLRNERIIVRSIPDFSNGITDKSHLLYGGMLDGAQRTFVVQKRTDGLFTNVLTNAEKDFLEHIMGLEENALSIYKKEDNFWDDSNPNGINKVTLTKGDNYLNLANPEDYIKYKILLSNKDTICKSKEELELRRKASYQFVIIEEQDNISLAEVKMNSTLRAYMEFGSIKNDRDKLGLIIEMMSGRPYSTKDVNIVVLQTKVNDLIQGNANLFLNIVDNSHLGALVLIKKGLDSGVLVQKNELLYHKATNTPLCGEGQNATKNVAAKFLDDPAQQELRLTIENEIKVKQQ